MWTTHRRVLDGCSAPRGNEAFATLTRLQGSAGARLAGPVMDALCQEGEWAAREGKAAWAGLKQDGGSYRLEFRQWLGRIN